MRGRRITLMVLCLGTVRVLAQQTVPPEAFRPSPDDRRMLDDKQGRVAARLHGLEGDPADVAVLLHCARMADRLNLYTNKSQVTLVQRGLDLALERADALTRRQRPWAVRPGKSLRGYRSRVDGSVQPYGVVLPAGFDPVRTYPLHVILHGRGPTEVTFLGQMEPDPTSAAAKAPDQPFLELHPFGRGNNGWRWSGETDVFEALEAFRAQYRVDPNRIVLRGFSMGGHGAWHIGVHYPDLWSAVSPGAGFSETSRYQKIVPGTLPPYQEAGWHIYDAVDYALNTFNTLFVGYGGEKDPQLAAARNMEEAARREGLALKVIVGPGVEHRYHPDSFTEIMRLVQQPARNPNPTEIRFTTWTLKYNRCHWLTVEALGTHYRRADVRARLEDGTLRLTTANVAGLRLAAMGAVQALEIDGAKVAGTSGGFEKRGGRWRPNARLTDAVNTRRLPALSKRHGLQGPIDDAFTERFLVVRGTGTPWSAATQAWTDAALSRFASEWRTGFRGELPVKDDKGVTPGDGREANLVLFGDPGSNAVLARVLPGLPIRWTRAGLEVASVKYGADAVPVMVFPNPEHNGRYVVINSGHTWTQKEIAASNAQLFPRLPDWAVLQPQGEAAKVLAADYFDERWDFKKTKATQFAR